MSRFTDFFDIRIIWFIKTVVFYRFRFKRIGNQSYLGGKTFWKGTEKVIIGNSVRIFPGSRIEVYGTNAFINIGNDVSIGHNFHIVSGGQLIIKDSVTISGNVFVNNMDFDYSEIGVSARRQPPLIRDTVIGNYCFIGYGAVIQSGTILGDNVIVGANSTVKGVFPNNCVIAGSPARILFTFCLDRKEWIREV